MIIDKSKAKVVLFVGMPEGQKNMKWFNYANENSLPVNTIIERMTNRLLSGKLSGRFNKAIFYDAQTNRKLMEI